VNRSWVWLLLLLLLLRLAGGVLPLLGDASQRRVNSIASDRDDSNASLVRREFGRRLAAHVSDVYAHGSIHAESVSVAAGNYSVPVLT